MTGHGLEYAEALARWVHTTMLPQVCEYVCVCVCVCVCVRVNVCVRACRGADDLLACWVHTTMHTHTHARMHTHTTHGPQNPRTRLWTSTLKRTIETGKFIKHEKMQVDGKPWITMRPRQWHALDEIHAGIFDGMTYEGVCVCGGGALLCV